MLQLSGVGGYVALCVCVASAVIECSHGLVVMTKRVIEETNDGWTQLVRAQVIYQDASGRFVSREDYVANREESGYGEGGYGN